MCLLGAIERNLENLNRSRRRQSLFRLNRHSDTSAHIAKKVAQKIDLSSF
jgi:hypothetical protein